MKTNAKDRHFGSMATIFTVIFVAAVFMVNLLVGFVSERLNLSVDMTAEQLYTLSDDTKEILDNLDEEVRMYVLVSEADFSNLEASKLLDQYVAYGKGKVKLSYIDPLKNPNFTKDYNIVGSIDDYSVVFIVESDKRYKVDDSVNMYGFLQDESGNYHMTSFDGESLVSSAILYVTKDELPTVTFTAGHNEFISDSLRQLINYNGFSIEEVNLQTGDISPESKMLFISAPTTDFTQAEIGKLEKYFSEHRDAIVFHGLSGPKLELFELYMKEWGVSFNMSLIIDPNRAVTNSSQIVPYLETHDLTSGMDIEGTMLVSQAVRPINILFESSGNKTVAPILTTSYNSFARPLDRGEVSNSDTKIDTDIAGPFNIAALSLNKDFTTDGAGKVTFYENGILFVGSSTFIADDYMKNASIQNSEFIVAAIKYLIGDEIEASSFYVAPKGIESARLAVYGAANYVVIGVLALVPLAILIFGLVYWMRRRHL